MNQNGLRFTNRFIKLVCNYFQMQRVQKLLSNYGYCSRRKAEELIAAGKVKVNDKIISLGDKATEKDKITVEGKEVKKERKVYLMFNKPAGCVTALRDERYKTVMDYIKIKERVFPIGRLDFNTSGLLLLTNDGDFANRLMHPRYEVNKTYLVQTDRNPTKKETLMLEQGVKLEDGQTSPAKITIVKDNLLQITIHEGRNRIIRRMLKKVGIYVKGLKKIKVGRLSLGDLAEGKYRKLSEKEIRKYL